jgi:hypothetical protein
MAQRPGAAGSAAGWLASWPRRIVGALVLLEAAYLLAANLFLATPLGPRVVSRKPEKLTASWAGGWTILPGLVHLRGLELRGASRRAEWRAAADRGTALLWLPSLARRHLRLLAASLHGVETEIDPLPPPATPRPHRPPGWAVSLERLRLDGVHAVRFRQTRLAGDGIVRGRLRFQVRGPMELDLEELAFDGARLLGVEQEIARDVRLAARLHTEPYQPGVDVLADLIGGADGRLELDAAVESLAFLDAYLAKFPWLALGGAGTLAVDAELADGNLLSGSSLSLAGPRVEARFFDFVAAGSGRVDGRVPEAGDHVELEAALDEYAVARASDGATLLAGRDLTLRVVNDTPSIAHPASGVEVALRLPPAEVPDFAAFDAYLPEAVELALTGGSGEIAAELRYDTRSRDGEGDLRLSGKGVAASFGELALATDFALDARLGDADLEGGRVDISGSTLVFEGGQVTAGGEPRAATWWGRLTVPAGGIARPVPGPGEHGPAQIEVDLVSELADTAPFVAFLEQKVPKLAWFDRLLTIPEVSLAAGLRVEGNALGIEGLELIAGKKDQIEVRAELDVVDKAADGAVYARWRFLQAALALNRGDRDWHILHPRRWYDEAAAAYRSGAALPDARTTMLDATAERYMRLVLALGQHDPDTVDAYYGPPELAEHEKEAARALAEVRGEAERLRDELAALDLADAEEAVRLRRDYQARQLAALAARAAYVEGERLAFDEESQALYDAVAPRLPDESFTPLLEELAAALPGEAPLAERWDAYQRTFTIPPDRLDAVFSAAIAACRERTAAHLELPREESFRVEYVTGKPWSGYNWYQGGYQSLIQVNTDLPVTIDRAIDLACHEGYPGHHVYNVLLEKHLVQGRGWPEFTIYPLFTPQSLIAEGTANVGIEVAFPADERLAFERDTLFPLAGLDPARAEEYARLLALRQKLSYADTEAARRYLDGELDAASAAAWLVEHGLTSPERAAQRVRFFDKYRSYVINYNLGRDLVRAHLEATAGAEAPAERRWQEFGALLASPRLPDDLAGRPSR